MFPIARIGTTTRWSEVVIHNGTLYTVDVPAQLEADITKQTRELLSNLETTLNNAGSSKAHLLMCNIYLADIRDIDAFNAVWDTWVPAGSAPVRACVEARLYKPECKVEIQVVAALK